MIWILALSVVLGAGMLISALILQRRWGMDFRDLLVAFSAGIFLLMYGVAMLVSYKIQDRW